MIKQLGYDTRNSIVFAKAREAKTFSLISQKKTFLTDQITVSNAHTVNVPNNKGRLVTFSRPRKWC